MALYLVPISESSSSLQVKFSSNFPKQGLSFQIQFHICTINVTGHASTTNTSSVDRLRQSHRLRRNQSVILMENSHLILIEF